MILKLSKLLVLLVVGCLLLACKQSLASAEIDRAELVSRMANNSSPVILDARSVEEYAESHIPGAINIPHNNYHGLPEKLKIEKKHELVVYCESGRRAKMLIQTLEKDGYYEVRHLIGDMSGWRNAGLQTE